MNPGQSPSRARPDIVRGDVASVISQASGPSGVVRFHRIEDALEELLEFATVERPGESLKDTTYLVLLAKHLEHGKIGEFALM
jgi:hypothetical protein